MAKLTPTDVRPLQAPKRLSNRSAPPLVCVDGVAGFMVRSGMIDVSLIQLRSLPNDDGELQEVALVAATLRLTPGAAKRMRDMIDGALLALNLPQPADTTAASGH